ncbi:MULTISPECIES: YbhB/YbcL family Raf kinase inhibitor-like protein [unclassified Aureispira]|uniref:YbhB/YbcL family Raf kinase inhibitor-like protein n=1 Tax=unclassified Aureispira TaxID=2649989 RepID=UPI00069610E7|nr:MULTISPECIES: YbhB/YbcL family Raf kinase inhibitor-like protein [unclassified Aureispira]WMX13321.1 YbhB/YbcL family Raf kinase inhibitor-like protein [Aureispira sp. CCB-E]
MYQFLVFISIFLFSFNLKAQTFTLESNDLGGQATLQQVFNGFGCTGENISPQLSWKNAPKGTKSFAITMYDPDAPTGSGWWHWLAFDIPSTTKELKSGAGKAQSDLLPTGVIQSLTDYGTIGYGGPCPPEGHGFHTYILTVYALNTDKLGVDEKANPALVGYMINSKTIEKASIVVYYKR